MNEQQLEARLRRLEVSRYKNVGELNAHRTMLLSAWMTLIHRSSEPTDEILAKLKTAWLQSAHKPLKKFPSIDPIELDAMSQEYESSISALLVDLESAIHQTR